MSKQPSPRHQKRWFNPRTWADDLYDLHKADSLSLVWLALSILMTLLATGTNLHDHHWRGPGYWMMFLPWLISAGTFITICKFSRTTNGRAISFREATREARVLSGLMLLITVDTLLGQHGHTWLNKFTEQIESDSWLDAGGWIFTFGLVVGLWDALCDRPKKHEAQHAKADTPSPTGTDAGTD